MSVPGSWAFLLTCFSPDRLTCPLNSAVVLASYAVQCKSPRECFTPALTAGFSGLTMSLPLSPRDPVGKASLVAERVPLAPRTMTHTVLQLGDVD